MASEHPNIQVAIYGEPGTKKSRFAATFPTPGLVAAFDPRGKMTPYREQGDEIKKVVSKSGIPAELIYRDGELLWRIEYYHDVEGKPDALRLFRIRFGNFGSLQTESKFKTLVLDSVSSMNVSARAEQRYVVNPLAVEEGTKGSGEEMDKKSMAWSKGQTDALEPWLMNRLPFWDINVIIICHVEEGKSDIEIKGNRRDKRMELHGEKVRGIAAPGRLGRSYGLFRVWSEVYRAYKTGVDDEGHTKVMLQTEGDDEWSAMTAIGARNPCPARYKALWKKGEKD